MIFLSFKQWLVERRQVEAEGNSAQPANGTNRSGNFPTFREWLADQEAQAPKGP
jgi:hypothetical protein